MTDVPRPPLYITQLDNYTFFPMFPTYFIWTNLSILAISVASLIVLLFNINPFEAQPKTLIYFLLSLFLGLATIICLFLYSLRMARGQKYLATKYMKVSVRQGFLVSVLVVGLLLLLAMKSLNWWDGLLLVASIVLIELYFRN